MAKKKKKSSTKNKKNSDLKILIILGITLIFTVAIYSDAAGILSELSQKYLYGLFGVFSYLAPVLIIYILSVVAFEEEELKHKRIIGACIISTSISLLIGAIYINTNSIDTLWDKLISFKSNSLNCGIIGYFITYPISRLIGIVGSYIIYTITLIIGILYAFNLNLRVVFEKIQLSLKNISVRKQEDIKKKPKITKEKLVKEEKITPSNDNEDDIQHVIDIVVKEDSKITNSTSADYKEELDQLYKDSYNEDIDTFNHSVIKKPYVFPSIELLNNNPNVNQTTSDKNSLLKKAEKLEETLKSFSVDAKVLKVTKGPSVTRFELAPSPGVKVSKIVNLQDDIALGLAANGVRMEAPIPGKAAIGIEVPNDSQTPVFLRELFESEEFSDSRANLAFAVGENITGKCIVGDLSKMPHTLIAGATGSGKSVCINTLIVSLLYKYSPDDVKLLMVDPKVVELSVYNGIPHLLIPVVTDPKKAAGALNWAVNEMNRRYNLFSTLKVKNIDSYNNLSVKDDSVDKLPYIVIIIDELADLMMACPSDIEDYICRLAQMARAAGMHIIIATQRPSTDVITGVIKANIPSRISFAVSSGIDSRTILDGVGAEKLLGKGDMLYYPSGESKPVRIQGAFISEEEVERIVNFIKVADNEISYEEDIITHINNNAATGSKTKTKNSDESENSGEDDALIGEAIRIVVQYQQASTSFLQRKMRIGFNRASRLMDELEDRGVISKRDGSKPRDILIKE